MKLSKKIKLGLMSFGSVALVTSVAVPFAVSCSDDGDSSSSNNNNATNKYLMNDYCKYDTQNENVKSVISFEEWNKIHERNGIWNGNSKINVNMEIKLPSIPNNVKFSINGDESMCLRFIYVNDDYISFGIQLSIDNLKTSIGNENSYLNMNSGYLVSLHYNNGIFELFTDEQPDNTSFDSWIRGYDISSINYGSNIHLDSVKYYMWFITQMKIQDIQKLYDYIFKVSKIDVTTFKLDVKDVNINWYNLLPSYSQNNN